MSRKSKSGWLPVSRLALLLVLGVLLLFLEALAYFYIGEPPRSQSSEPVTVVIPAGVGVARIGEILGEAGLVAHPKIFQLGVRLAGAEYRLQAGQVSLTPGLSLSQLIERLTHVSAMDVRVAVREGLTAAQVAGLLQSKADIDSSSFMQAVFDSAFAESLGYKDASLEGYLFPDTYMFYRGMSARRAAMRMAWNFRRKVPDSIFRDAKKWNMTPHQIVTMASIVQWEVLRRDEWEIVSSVYHNRLRRRMLLQADPTVNYALGQGPSRLTYRDLKIDSPFNTYKYKGLPPGPINNPGLRAIRAALQPKKTDYLFFVARGDGSHAFSRTGEEHNRAKAEAKAARAIAREDTTRTG